MYHDEMTASARADHGLAQGTLTSSPSPTRGSSTTSTPARRTGRPAAPRSKPASRRWPPGAARWPSGAAALLAALPGARRARPARLSRLLLRRPALRPGPARQRRQRPAPARPAPARAVAARRRRGSTPSCWRCRSRRVRGWMDGVRRRSRVYRFSIEDLYRQQAHVLDAAGERLLSLSAQFGHAADDSLRRARRPPTPRSRPSRCRPARR